MKNFRAKVNKEIKLLNFDSRGFNKDHRLMRGSVSYESQRKTHDYFLRFFVILPTLRISNIFQERTSTWFCSRVQPCLIAIPGIKCKIFINNSFTNYIFQTPQIGCTVFLDNIYQLGLSRTLQCLLKVQRMSRDRLLSKNQNDTTTVANDVPRNDLFSCSLRLYICLRYSIALIVVNFSCKLKALSSWHK